ncbi:tRNA pseudouridine(13) synthase TruD [archaeon]|jgi:tRNA pseudouridine13 synthase|nr:tRNA pseudouridine(13) synthase TruD [archaeon]MBT6183110.1 tRNA pseudouridine(13) synthase TruD [archaeon]MBT6606717.1 tRNA pseudouridine(13) synthase TruD [archaeon]MBT7251960.1 tRNA pseudouridine(13) synthase TruD [archaeon]MBT7660639.1 tRNA pseudouridine(13) synthase TruD [archaeon]
MKEIVQFPAKLKTKVRDFIVEERGDNWDCKVSEEFDSRAKVDLTGLEENSLREFLLCEMEKREIDHFSAIKDVARVLGKSVDAIGYAGTKDKFAVTSQRISIFRPDMERVRNFNHPNIVLKNFRWSKRKIKMGYLQANHFRIILRDMDSKAAIKSAQNIRSLQWFPNYFGPQRFGSLRKNNVRVGTFILKREFEKAILAILTDTAPTEKPDITFAREKLAKAIRSAKTVEEKKNVFSDAARYFPAFLKLEKELLFYLGRKPEDFIGSLKRAQRKNVLMFVHSVQSHIFNQILETALSEGLDFTKEGQQNCILAGYKTRFFDGRLGEIERQVLEENNLTLDDFNVVEISFLRMKGSYRRAITEIKDLEVEISDGEEFSGSKKMTLEFTLPSGVYATTFLENFFVFE